MISDIVVSIRESSTTGIGFVRFDTENRRWYVVDDKIARDKVGQSLRAYSSKKKPKETPFSRKRTRAKDKPETKEFIRAPLAPSPPITGAPETNDWIQMKPIDAVHPMWSNRHLSAQLAPPDTTAAFAAPTENASPIDKILPNDCCDGDNSSDNSLIDWFEADAKGMK